MCLRPSSKTDTRWIYSKKKKKNILLVDRSLESNCPFACTELWKKVQLPIQQTCSKSNMPEHNRDCTPLCVELPLLRPHAVYSPRSKIDRGGGCEVCHPQREVPRSTGQRVCSKGAGEEAKDRPHQVEG